MNRQQYLISVLRFIGYVGSSTSTLILPILVYKITNSPFFAGLTMFFEWIPKLWIYLFGGHILLKVGIKKIYLLMDGLRAFSFILFMLAIHFNNQAYIFIAAPIMQGMNGFSNIIFELFVVSWWPVKGRLKGFSQLFYLDLLASVLILPIIGLLPIRYIIVVGFCVFLFNFIIGFLNKYRHIKPLERLVFKSSCGPRCGVISNFVEVVKNKELFISSFVSFCFAVPSVLINTQMFFFLKNFNSNITNFISFIADYRAFIFFASVCLLFMLRFVKNPLHILMFSYFMIISSFIVLSLSKNMNLFLISFMFYTFGLHSYIVFNKSYRQNMIPKEKRFYFTGILSSIEAFSYIFSGLLFLAFSGNQDIIFSICFILILFSIWNFTFFLKKGTNEIKVQKI